MISPPMKLTLKVATCQLMLLLLLIDLMLVRASNQLYRLDETPELLAHAGQQNHNTPGHYEFEVAPNMVPPAVRKPPYPQSAQMCSGLGFSPKDSLCGDLNQGRVPINPLGQMIGDQSYPFELIKNKTLQFLARALPVLKLEYETIPKVARYLPTNHLLNPTHHASPIGHEHMHQVNQRLAAAASTGFATVAADDYGSLGGPSYMVKSARRRRKRSVGQGSVRAASSNPSGILVAEMSPNATLVVSSAHSSTGRIHSLARSELGGGDSPQLAVITKDGYKPVNGATAVSNRAQHHNAKPQRNHPLNSVSYYNNWSSTSGNIVQTVDDVAGQSKSQGSPLSNGNEHTSPPQTTTNKVSHKLVQSQTAANVSRSNNQASAGATNVNENNGDRQQNGYGFQHHQQQVAANSSNSPHATITSYRTLHNVALGEQGQVDVNAPAGSAGGGSNNFDGQTASSLSESTSSSTSASAAASSNHGNSNSNQQQQALAKQDTSTKRRLSCGDSSNGFSSAICQAAAALIEGDRPPAWLQLVKHLGYAYSGASSDSLLGGSSGANSGASIWSIFSGLAQQEPTSSAKSSASNLGSKTNGIVSLLGPIGALLSSNSMTPVAAKDSSGSPRQESQNSKEHQQVSPFASTLASALGSSTMTKLAIAGWASNAIAGLVEYFVPSVFQSFSNSRTFSKRKKPFDPQEQFVDTPASMALTAASTNLPRQALVATTGGSGGGPSPVQTAKQPPTPCPSVEEYISPTFARNYQGAWKYVVQIPHEGYFTQTIQRTSCVRQKCEFTEGICHESPRWVSLLVAEIYYPNTIFGQQPDPLGSTANSNHHLQQPLAVSPSTSSIQQTVAGLAQQQQFKPTAQDPLQMTDSLSNYNHNLNNAFINAANELGWDPNNVANMQHLANAYSYQLMQRNGLLSGQQQQQIENRQGIAQPVGEPQFTNQPQQQVAQSPQQLYSAQPFYNTDYTTALAAAALQQNPNMSIQELINSLQLQQQQTRRKKRDLGPTRPNRGQYPSSSQAAIAQHRSSIETAPSINDITAHTSLPGQQQSVGPNQFNKQQQQAQQMPDLQTATTFSVHNQHQHQSQQPIQQASSTSQSSQMGAASGNDQAGMSNQATGEPGHANQVECDGHDKLGCYVVRVYYDWFLVNGSCKCWKTTTGQSGGQSSSGNSFLRRIFTG